MQQFGREMKAWRRLRRMSQMDLGMAAEVSPRHISFLETGRSRPSRGMVLRLSEELQMPAAARNQLLLAAGMAPMYRPADAREPVADLAPLQQALDWMLQRHAPYPGMAINRHWQLVAMNEPAAALLAGAGIGLGDSLIAALLHNEGLRDNLDNLAEVEALTLMRLRTEVAHYGQDPVLEQAVADLGQRVAVGGHQLPEVLPAVIPARYRAGGQVLSFFSTLSQFGSTGDIAMSELKIELLFPADAATRLALTGAAP